MPRLYGAVVSCPVCGDYDTYKAHTPHVRFVVGETVLYDRFPDRVCIVEQVHDAHVPVHYDIGIPLDNGDEGLRGTKLHARGIFPHALKSVDIIPL